MRKIKRIVALVTVAMFLLSLAAPAAFAATKEEAFGRLNALSVAVGDQNGDPQYDKNFTRAEAAAIMVNLSGMKAAIEAAKGPTKFKDVPASHWASGVVNLAVGAGIIKGYPNGTFKPDANVSYAEMSAMLVQVLGYGPKLKGTWPSNVIGKAAELGLLDGVNVTDYNVAAVRSNVFLAADNALDVKVLTETKDGYQEDTKTLMEKKLNVTVKDEATVTGTPAYSSSLDKNKVKIAYASGHTPTDETLTTVDGINPDDFYGLKVKAWVKDDKVFFLDVKNDSSDVIVDTLDEIDGNSSGAPVTVSTYAAKTSIKLKNSAKTITVNGNTEWKMNYATLGTTAGTDTVGIGDAVKVILGSDGKAAKVLAQRFTTGLVDSIDATNEKIILDGDATWTGASSTIELKDKKVKLYKNGVIAKLADIKKGDIVDYVVSGDVRLVYANDKTVTGKISAVLDDGTTKDGLALKKFIFKVGDKDVKGGLYTFFSTNNGDTYDRNTRNGTGDYNAVINKDVTVKLNKDGKAALIIAGSASDSSEVPVFVKYIKKVATTDTNRYLYVAKFDGTNTYYVVTKDTKIDGVKINEDALKENSPFNGADGPRLYVSASKEIKAGDVVKITLNSDNTVNDIRTYGTDLEVSNGTQQFAVSKNNDTFSVSGGTNLVVPSDVKILRVKTRVVNNTGGADGVNDNITDPTVSAAAYWYDDVENVSWAAVEALDSAAVNSPASVVKSGGTAKYIVIKDPAVQVATDYYFGVVVAAGTNSNGDGYYSIGFDGKVEDKVGTISNAAKKKVVRFKLKADGKIDSGETYDSTNMAVYGVYNTFRVTSVSSDKRQLTLKPVDPSNNYQDVVGAPDQYFIIDNTKTKFWDVDSSTPVALTVDDLVGKKGVQLYDVWNKDQKDTSTAAGGYAAGTRDGVYDFVLVTAK